MSIYTKIVLIMAILHSLNGVPVEKEDSSQRQMDENLPDPYQVDLAESAECSMDVERICGKALMKTNFDVINCLQTSFRDYDISDKCQNLIWNYKKNITTDPKYEHAVKQICGTMIQKIPECQNLDQTRGHLIACLVEHISDPDLQPLALHCDSFLKRLEPVVFGDYRIIYKFTEACQADIDRLHCGRVHEGQGNQQAPYHNQGTVLSCLATSLNDLNSVCKFELLRVSELQGTDYHFDRQLFFACRNDRERFCKDVESGEGRVYRCLTNHKTHPEMSQKCQDKLLVHQLLEQEDYKVNYKLSHACKVDIEKNSCDKAVSTVAGFARAKMSAVVLCLESVEHAGGSVEGECRGQVKDVRRGLMEDYRVSPQLVVSCSHEIEKHCGGDLKKDGSTIHCLMQLAPPSHDGKNKFEKVLSKQCLVALRELLLEADVISEPDVDPFWHASCGAVQRAYCADVAEEETYDCLFNAIDKPLMTEACRVSLYQLEYFKSRDFRLDPELYRECREDAVKICKASPGWHLKTGEDEQDNVHILSCLYRHSWKTSAEPDYKAISKGCSGQVRRVMRQRALSVNLRPEVELSCMQDLSKHCLDRTAKEEEMECLEENWAVLSPECQRVVGEVVGEVDRDPELSEIFVRWCKPVLDQRCPHVAERDGGHVDERGGRDLMGCLLKHKDDKLMNKQCKAGVEHHQLMMMKDIKFSFEMNQACLANIQTFCRGIISKDQIVLCLSEVRLNDTLLDHVPRLSGECLEELKGALTERSEYIDLDPELKEACGADMETHCSHVPHDLGEMHECLELNIQRVSKACKKVMFQRVQSEAIDMQTDFYFFNHCEGMIQEHCSEHSDDFSEELLGCLYRARDQPNFDDKCRRIVVSRAHLFGMDFRLNNRLQLDCRQDVEKFCLKELRQAQREDRHEGQVIECLKNVYVQESSDGDGDSGALSRSCSSHIRQLIVLTADDSLIDTSLSTLCSQEIREHCKGAILDPPSDHREDHGRIVECLKKKVLRGVITDEKNGKCFKQITRLVRESLIEVPADKQLHHACSSDLRTFCREYPVGRGKQLECLLGLYKDDRLKVHMKKECRQAIEGRLELWKIAAPDAELPKSLQQVVDLISSSPSSNYLFLLIFLLLLVIFVMGLCLGRMSNRLRRELKVR